jgi:hypothetical protein
MIPQAASKTNETLQDSRLCKASSRSQQEEMAQAKQSYHGSAVAAANAFLREHWSELLKLARSERKKKAQKRERPNFPWCRNLAQKWKPEK